MDLGGLNTRIPCYWTWGMKLRFEIFLHGKNRRRMSKIRETFCGTLELCCALKFSKKHFTNLAYQSRGTGDAVLCYCHNGHVW